MAKCILLLLLIFTNILFTLSMREDGEGGAGKRQKTVNIPTEQIIDLDSDDEDETPVETAGNSQQQNLPQNIQLVGHQTPPGQISPSSTNLESASSGKRKLGEMGAPMAPREGPRKYIQTQTDQKGFPIKIIETSFHYPNKNDFRDTVQRLTGKDSDHQNPSPSRANLQAHPLGNFSPAVSRGHHPHHSGMEEFPQEREISVITSSIKMGDINREQQQGEEGYSSSSGHHTHQHHPQHHQHNPPSQNVMMAGGSGGSSGAQFQPKPMEIMVDAKRTVDTLNAELNFIRHDLVVKLNSKTRLQDDNVRMASMPTIDPEEVHRRKATNLEEITKLVKQIDGMQRREGEIRREMAEAKARIRESERQIRLEEIGMVEERQRRGEPTIPPGYQLNAPSRFAQVPNPSENIIAVPTESKGKAIVGETSNAPNEVSVGDVAALATQMASVFNKRATKITSIVALHGEMDVLRTLAQSRVVGRQEMERKWAEKAAQIGTLVRQIDELGQQEAQTHFNLINTEQRHLLKPIPYETYLQDQFKRAQRKLGGKRRRQAELCQKIATLFSNTQGMVEDGRNRELGQNVAELAKVAQQIERLVYQDRAIFQRMVYEEKVREKIEWAEPQNRRLEDCGPGLLQCTYCDAILCEVYDSMCSWNSHTSRCVAYEIEAPAQN